MAGVAVAVASAPRPTALSGAAVEGMAVMAVAGAPQGRTGLSSVAVMEEMVDLAVVQASGSAPKLIQTALPESQAVSEEPATAVVAEVGVELSEARSSIKAALL